MAFRAWYFLLLFSLISLGFFGCSKDGRSSDLKITYLKDGLEKKGSYKCSGQGCDVLNGIIWKPVLPGELCAEGYGGTDLVFIKGDVNGERVNSSFQRTNMCEIARFNSLNTLLRYTGLSGGGQERQTASDYLKLSSVSHFVSSYMPFAQITVVVALLLLFLLGFFYFYITSLTYSWRAERHRAFSIVFPPFAIAFYLFSLYRKESRLSFEPRFLIDSAIILGTLFLPIYFSLAALFFILFLELKLASQEKMKTTR